MPLEIHETSLSQNKNLEYYKGILLGEFGLELDIERARLYGDKIRSFISHDPDIDGIAYAIKKSHEIPVISTLYYAGRISARVLQEKPGSLFILNIWITSPEDTLQGLKGDGIATQKAARLSDFFRREENKYALATILGLDVPNSDDVITDTERRTTEMLS